MPIKIIENYLLAPLTTFGVGGPARYFASVATEVDLKEAINFAKEENLPVFIISGGSNILISDEGFDGLVIKNNISGIKKELKDGKVLVAVGAGEDWDKLVEYSVNHGLEGLETLSGIPGSVGAAPVQNIGAYGREVSGVIKEVIAYDLQNNELCNISKNECGFGYRKSIFNDKHAGRYIIVEVVFEFDLPHDSRESKGVEFTYRDLQEYFKNLPNPTLKEIRKAVIEIRAKKGMVIRPEYESFKSAGSFFKNPTVSRERFEAIKSKIGENDSKWFWDEPDGRVKISAAKLIEISGYPKGFRLGKAGVSPKHSLSLINLGEANSEDIINLARTIIQGVYDKFGVRLGPEVLLIGFKENPIRE